MKRIATGIVIFLLCSCSQKQNNTSSEGAVTEEQPDQESWGVFLVLTREGVKTAEVRTGHTRTFSARNVSELSDSVVADFYNERGLHTSRLTALEAAIDNNRQIMLARKNVVVVSDSANATLKTSELCYDEQQEKIYTDKFITFITQTDTIYGYGFESDRSLNHYIIKNISGSVSRIINKKQ